MILLQGLGLLSDRSWGFDGGRASVTGERRRGRQSQQHGDGKMKQQPGLDEFDLEAMRDASAISAFKKNFSLQRPCTKAVMKAGVVRGKIGADSRKGLNSLQKK